MLLYTARRLQERGIRDCGKLPPMSQNRFSITTAPGEAGRILVVGPAWVGDAVMAQSLFKLLKQRRPVPTIDVLAPPWSQALLERMPEVSTIIALPLGHGQLGLRVRHRLGWKLRTKHYRQAIVLPNSLKSALIPFWARIPRRTGFVGELRWGLLNDVRRLDKTRLPRMVQRFAALGLAQGASLPEQLPRPALRVNADQRAATLAKYGLEPDATPVLGLCPGAEYGPAKRWPAAFFAEVAAAELIRGWAVWIFGSARDSPLGNEINARTHGACVDLTGRTSLAEAVDLMSLATVVVSNDSGLMHVAAALDRGLIALYGSSTPDFTPPLSDKAAVLSLQLPCSPCFERQCPLGHTNCLNDLLPARVLTAIEQKTA